MYKLHLKRSLLILILLSSVSLSISFTFSGTTPSSSTFTCHCSGDAACSSTRGATSGECVFGCDDETLPWAPWSGPGCQIGNVAYGKPAVQHTESNSNHPASNAVDGRRSRTSDDEQYSLASRTLSTDVLFWQVDLGKEHVVEAVYITTVDDQEESGNDIKVYVSSESDGYSSLDECLAESGGDTLTLICSEKVGRYVTVAGMVDNSQLWLAEVYVRGYMYHQCDHVFNNDFWYGPACLKNCHCSTQCDVITGTCASSCRAGYKGETCQVSCGDREWGVNCGGTCHCSRCDDDTGSCGSRTCDAGYRGDRCDVPCTSGFWGPGCGNRCTCENNGDVCNSVTGHCPGAACPQWFMGTVCQYEVPRLGSSIAPVFVYGNGRHVTIRFTQWTLQYGGDGEISDITYILQYARSGSSVYHDTSTARLNHVDDIEENEVNIELPEVRTQYTIRVLPYESSSVYDGAGEPSPTLGVYTECADEWYGTDCQYMFSEMCDQATGYCRASGSTQPAYDQTNVTCFDSKPDQSDAGLQAGIAVGAVLFGAVVTLCIACVYIKWKYAHEDSIGSKNGAERRESIYITGGREQTDYATIGDKGGKIEYYESEALAKNTPRYVQPRSNPSKTPGYKSPSRSNFEASGYYPVPLATISERAEHAPSHDHSAESTRYIEPLAIPSAYVTTSIPRLSSVQEETRASDLASADSGYGSRSAGHKSTAYLPVYNRIHTPGTPAGHQVRPGSIRSSTDITSSRDSRSSRGAYGYF